LKEKTTKLLIMNPKLTREELQNHMGCPPVKADFYTVAFDRRVITNRCPPEIADELSSTIKADSIHRWKFQRSGGLLYKEALSKLAKELGVTEIVLDGRKIPKWIQVTSRQTAYLEHDKKIMLLAQRLRRKEIIAFPSSCSETSDTCEVPPKEHFLKAIGYHELKEASS